MKAEVAVLGSPTLTRFKMVTVDVKVTLNCTENRAQELCEGRLRQPSWAPPVSYTHLRAHET